MPTVPLFRSLIASAAEPEATANTIVLGEHETTGLLPVGFVFERFGARFDHFDLSTDGFVRFCGHPRRGGVDGSFLVGRGGQNPLGGGRVTYEVRGSPPRRRLVVSFAEVARPWATLQLVVYERTGIVEVRDGPGQSLGDPTIRQLDITQSPESLANSARKIG